MSRATFLVAVLAVAGVLGGCGRDPGSTATHGYDRKAEIPAGSTGSVSFTANASGVFEVELEESKLLLARLQVS